MKLRRFSLPLAKWKGRFVKSVGDVESADGKGIKP